MKQTLITFLLFIIMAPVMSFADDSVIEPHNKIQDNANTAMGMAATGLGGMMVASGVYEQIADKAADEEMAEYIGKLRCEYGSNNSIPAGTANVETYSGNELFQLYNQYTTLANRLARTKKALGLAPGIESAVVIDKAKSGLYDDGGTYVVGGRYASVASAILYDDDEKLSQERNNTEQKLEIGAIAAGVGMIGAAISNTTDTESKK